MPTQRHGLSTLAGAIYEKLHLLRVRKGPNGIRVAGCPVPMGEGVHEWGGWDEIRLVPVKTILGEAFARCGVGVVCRCMGGISVWGSGKKNMGSTL